MPDQQPESVPDFVPHYTGSLDAGVPGEHIVCIEYDESANKWIAVNRNERGVLHIGVGNTEALARRIAGLKAYAAQKNGAAASIVGLPARRDNRHHLLEALDRLTDAIEQSNEYRIADPQDQRRRLAEVRKFRSRLRRPGAIVATVAASMTAVLAYLATKFADSLIGKLADAAAKLLEALVGS